MTEFFSQDKKTMSQYRSSILKETAQAKGACLVGFADISGLGLPITQKYPFAICFAIRHDIETINNLPDDELWNKMSSSLTQKAGIIYNEIQILLEKWDYNYSRIPSTTRIDELPVPGEELPQKMIATLSGLGWIGRSSLLITPDYGPRVRLGTLLTDMSLDTGIPIVESRCGDCKACVEVCPVTAIKGNCWAQTIPRNELLDVTLCYDHLWSAKETIGRRQLCGLCLKVCPVGQSE